MKFDDAARAFVGLAASRHNAVHTNEAADIGMSLRRLQRAKQGGELRSLRPKVWAHTSLPSGPKQELRAATLALPDSAASHQSAAWLHGWLEHPPDSPHVWVPPASRSRTPGASVHRAQGVRVDDVIEVDRIRVLSRAATLCLLGATSPAVVVERCLDEFLRNDSSAWLDDVMNRLWSTRSKGLRVLAAVRNDPRRVAGVTDSWMERVVSQLVALPWMPPLELQHCVTAMGRAFRLDIGVPELKLGLEAHGRTFHWGPGKEDADNVRDLVLAAEGWKLVYVTWSQIRDPDEFVRLFAATARVRAEQLGIRLRAA